MVPFLLPFIGGMAAIPVTKSLFKSDKSTPEEVAENVTNPFVIVAACAVAGYFIYKKVK